MELRARTAFGISVVAAVMLSLVPLSASAGSSSTGGVIRVRGTIQTIAVDGPRVAYDRFVPAAGCDKVFVADLPTGMSRPVSGCFPYISTSRYLGLAGRRIAWIAEACDPGGCDRTLWAGSLSRRPRRLAAASCDGDLDVGEPCVGTWISSLVGSGGLLAINLGATNGKGVDTKFNLDVIGRRGLGRIVSGPRARHAYAQAADSGRIAVLRPNGTVGIFSAGGRLLLQVKPTSVAEGFDGDAVALRGDYLLVLTRTRRLEVYNSHSGARLHSWPVHKGATNLAAGAGLAAYAAYPYGPGAGGGAPYTVHVVRLATGKDVVVGTGKWFTAQRDVGLGSAGLVYLQNRGTLVVIPLGRVLAAVS